MIRIKASANIILGITTEVLYALAIMLMAFFICLALTGK
jgi:hypothetical protein